VIEANLDDMNRRFTAIFGKTLAEVAGRVHHAVQMKKNRPAAPHGVVPPARYQQLDVADFRGDTRLVRDATGAARAAA